MVLQSHDKLLAPSKPTGLQAWQEPEHAGRREHPEDCRRFRDPRGRGQVRTRGDHGLD